MDDGDSNTAAAGEQGGGSTATSLSSLGGDEGNHRNGHVKALEGKEGSVYSIALDALSTTHSLNNHKA